MRSVIMKYIVEAQAFHPQTGKPLAKTRKETIDSTTNKLFANCWSILEVKMTYERFWNEIGSGKENPKELVFVQSITPIHGN